MKRVAQEATRLCDLRNSTTINEDDIAEAVKIVLSEKNE